MGERPTIRTTMHRPVRAMLIAVIVGAAVAIPVAETAQTIEDDIMNTSWAEPGEESPSELLLALFQPPDAVKASGARSSYDALDVQIGEAKALLTTYQEAAYHKLRGHKSSVVAKKNPGKPKAVKKKHSKKNAVAKGPVVDGGDVDAIDDAVEAEFHKYMDPIGHEVDAAYHEFGKKAKAVSALALTKNHSQKGKGKKSKKSKNAAVKKTKKKKATSPRKNLATSEKKELATKHLVDKVTRLAKKTKKTLKKTAKKAKKAKKAAKKASPKAKQVKKMSKANKKAIKNVNKFKKLLIKKASKHAKK